MESIQTIDPPKFRYRTFSGPFGGLRLRSAKAYLQLKFLGHCHTMDDYEQRKLRIFNLLNFFQAFVGLLLPLLAIVLPGSIPKTAWLYGCLPALTNIAVLVLTSYRKHAAALLTYFFVYPFCICLIYLNGMNPGLELYFILLVILSVFFINDITTLLLSIGFSMISFFTLADVLENFIYDLREDNHALFLLNNAVTLAFIFYGLMLVKRENTVYQNNILAKQRKLSFKNLEIERQKEEITANMRVLEAQKQELAGLNATKNRMFSIISHDLKAPIFALRTLFQNMHQFNIPAADIKAMVPEVLKDINNTTNLMENLLQWSKSQMQTDAVRRQVLQMRTLAEEITQLLRQQLQAKNLSLQVKKESEALAYADRNMIHSVVRNLVANAIKFTPTGGSITIGIEEAKDEKINFYVEDTGVGISEEAIEKIGRQNFYTTTGTASETGTGLGLLLCTEFLVKNDSRLEIESIPGRGSRFSFCLPKADCQWASEN
ncbi:HAMP domain-containing histidine kinase [Flavisolibacter sp. BT320]|nr:HAMP domain-containing histidine kinase [Flavisolibacter longurius]